MVQVSYLLKWPILMALSRWSKWSRLFLDCWERQENDGSINNLGTVPFVDEIPQFFRKYPSPPGPTIPMVSAI